MIYLLYFFILFKINIKITVYSNNATKFIEEKLKNILKYLSISLKKKLI